MFEKTAIALLFTGTFLGYLVIKVAPSYPVPVAAVVGLVGGLWAVSVPFILRLKP